jgi:hypothetical protein
MTATPNKKKAQKGNYYKQKTKVYFQNLGYTTEYLERYKNIFTPNGILHIKQDLFGCDGMSMNGEQIIFWNSKFIGVDSSNTLIRDSFLEFQKFPFPKSEQIKLLTVVWRERQRYPELIEVKAIGKKGLIF